VNIEKSKSLEDREQFKREEDLDHLKQTEVFTIDIYNRHIYVKNQRWK